MIGKPKFKKDILYKAYKKKYLADKEIEEIAEEVGVEADQIVIKKVSGMAKAIEACGRIGRLAGKILLWGSGIILSTIGATIVFNCIVNPQFRETIFNFFNI